MDGESGSWLSQLVSEACCLDGISVPSEELW